MATPPDAPHENGSAGRMREALAWIERHFVHPKLGLPYDYFSPAGECPRRAFGASRDAKQNLPNAHGFGAGFALTAQNLALLLDGALLRLELGIGDPAEEDLAERFAEGLLRLATATPKHVLARGLAADGRAYYAGVDAATAVAFAHACWRALTTPCLPPDFQERLRAAAVAWTERAEKDAFRLTFPDGRPLPGGDLSAPVTGLRGPWLMALASFAAWIAPTPERSARLAAWTAEADGLRCRPSEAPPAAAEPDSPDAGVETREEDDPWTAVWRQYARTLAERLAPDDDVRSVWSGTLRTMAGRLLPGTEAWRGFDPGRFPEPVAYDWRQAPRPTEGPGPKDHGAPGCGGWSERRTGFTLPPSWARLAHESDTLRTGLSRALCGMLGGDKEVCAALSEEWPALRETVAWNQTQTCASAALAVAVHAYGVSLGLWDAELPETRRVAPAKNESFAARFLEPDYDEVHPDQAGHGDPKTPEKTEEGNRNRRPRRRRRRR